MSKIKKLAVKRLKRRTTGKLKRTATLLTVTIVGSALLSTVASVAGAFLGERDKRL